MSYFSNSLYLAYSVHLYIKQFLNRSVCQIIILPNYTLLNEVFLLYNQYHDASEGNISLQYHPALHTVPRTDQSRSTDH